MTQPAAVVLRGTKRGSDAKGVFWSGWIFHSANLCRHRHPNREAALYCARDRASEWTGERTART